MEQHTTNAVEYLKQKIRYIKKILLLVKKNNWKMVKSNTNFQWQPTGSSREKVTLKLFHFMFRISVHLIIVFHLIWNLATIIKLLNLTNFFFSVTKPVLEIKKKATESTWPISIDVPIQSDTIISKLIIGQNCLIFK